MEMNNPNLIASFKIILNGKALETNYNVAVKSVSFQEELNVPGMFSLQLSLIQAEEYSFEGISLKEFEPGREVKLLMGLDQNKELIRGEITALDIDFSEGCSATVRGYDPLHRLRFGTKKGSIQNMKESELISDLIRDSGLKLKFSGEDSQNKYLFQNNVPNFEYLMERARNIGYEVLVSGSDLLFRPPQDNAPSVVTLQNRLDLKNFSVQLGALTQGSEMEQREYDPMKKTAIVSKTQKGNQSDTGFTISEKYRKSTTVNTSGQVFSEAEAERKAKALQDELLQGFIQGSGTCIGNPSVRAGNTVEIKGCGSRFSGKYYITSTTHSFNWNEGYMTQFQVRRKEIKDSKSNKGS